MDTHTTQCRFVKANVDNTACSCGFLDRDSKRTFEQRHAIVHHDPLVELKRRMAPWAVCPQLRGQPLDAQIVPVETLDAAIAELHMWRKLAETSKPRELGCATSPAKQAG